MVYIGGAGYRFVTVGVFTPSVSFIDISPSFEGGEKVKTNFSAPPPKLRGRPGGGKTTVP